MTLLLELREKIKQVYGRYSTFLLPALKFILAFVLFKGINSSLGFLKELDSIFLLLILSLICSIMPLNLMVFFGMFLLVSQCFGVGIEVAGFAVALILVLMILYIRFTPQDALVLLLTPVAFKLGVPCVIPIGYGLTKSPASAVSSGFGVVVYYFIQLVSQNSSMLKGADAKESIQNLKVLLDGMLKNQEMMINIIAFVAVLLLVNVIRRLSVDYAWQIAIFAGAISYIVIIVTGGILMDVKSPVIPLIAGTVGAVIIAEILEFFLFHVDYSRTETLQFEDDEYYYYVKAVPKMSIAKKDVTIKTIEEPEESGFPGGGATEDISSYQAGQAGPVPQETIAFTGIQKQLLREEQAGEVPGEKTGEIPPVQVDYESKLEESLKDL